VNMLDGLLFPDDRHARTITSATDKTAAPNRSLVGSQGSERLASRPEGAV
jgi:hypothetical protein